MHPVKKATNLFSSTFHTIPARWVGCDVASTPKMFLRALPAGGVPVLQEFDMSGIQFKEVNAADLKYMDPGAREAAQAVRSALGSEYAGEALAATYMYIVPGFFIRNMDIWKLIIIMCEWHVWFVDGITHAIGNWVFTFQLPHRLLSLASACSSEFPVSIADATIVHA